MAFPIGVAIGGVIEMIKLGTNILEKYNNGTLTQEEFDQEWAEMQSRFKAADDRWIESKQSQGQS